MTKLELMEMLTREAREFRKDRNVFFRNNHMHDMIDERPSQVIVDAVLVTFINHIGAMQGLDYGLYTRDLMKEDDMETYSMARFSVSKATFNEILKKLIDAGYEGDHFENEFIDMNGFRLVRQEEPPPPPPEGPKNQIIIEGAAI